MTIADVDHETHAHRGEFSCPTCMEHIRQFEALLQDFDNLQREHRRALRKINTLEKDKPKASRPKKTDDGSLRKHAKYEEAVEVWEFWRQHVSPKAREFGGKRLQNVIARLEAGYTVKQLKLACYGIARHPTVLYGKTYNDLELVARDPAKTDDFIARGTLALEQDGDLPPAESPDEHAERRARHEAL